MNKLEKVFSRKYVLASKSQRRGNLLYQIGLNFISIDSGAKERDDPEAKPLELVKHNALLKSRKVAFNFKDEIVIGADTIVAFEGEILNKPADHKEAVKYLRMLSGKKHYVYTGFNIIDTRSGKERYDYVRTTVYFRELEKYEIDYYVKTFEPLDKAGAYGIQDDFACLFIDKINGDYYNIVGLPLERLYKNLTEIV